LTLLRLVVDVPVPPHLEGTMGLRSAMTVSLFSILVLYFHVLMLNFSGERYYDPRPYDSRYARDFDHEDRRGGGGGGGRGRYDDRPRDYERGYRDYDRGPRDYDRGYGREPRDYDRRHDDRRY
jgi:hypothetical protein